MHPLKKRHTIALVDDEVLLIDSLAPLLAPDFETLGFSRPAEALDHLSTNPVAVVLADYRMPIMDGIELLSRLKRAQPDTVGILFTAFGDLDCLSRAINVAGVFHYISKDRLAGPDGFEEVSNLLQQAVELYAKRTELKTLLRKLASENEFLQAEHEGLRNQKPHSLGRRCFTDLIGNSVAIQNVRRQGQLANRLRTDVHIHGETGTGKEILAQALHYESDRCNHPFVAVNCGALARDLVSSEFFGHRKGAFTGAMEEKKGIFESADHGTVFLDEIGELPLEIQPALLRVLQEKEVSPLGASKARPIDVRIISATHRDLAYAATTGQFRPDLLHRLNNGITIAIPPLRERREDVPVLAQHFFSHFRQEFSDFVIQGLSAEGISALEQYPFAGNVRELANVIKHAIFAAILDGRSHLKPDDFGFQATNEMALGGKQGGSLRDQKDTVTRGAIIDSLRQHSWNITQAAGDLGVSREWLSKLMKQYVISKPQGQQ